MTKLYLAVIALGLAGIAATPWNKVAPNQSQISKAVNAPFRDGLYLGRLTAESGSAPHISAGRWANNSDRVAFAEGYRAGYAGSSVSTATLER